MTAAIGVERAEQAMLANHLAQGLERRRRAFFLDQQHRIDLTRRIVHRHDQVHRGQAFDPGVARPVLMQQHARKRPAWTLLAVRRTLRRLPHQASRMQGKLRHRIAQHIAMPLLQLLVEVLHREVRILVAEQPQHPLQLFLRRSPRRSPTHTQVDKPVIALRLVALRPTLKRPHVDPEKLSRCHLRQFLRLGSIQQIRKSHPSYTLVSGRRAHRAPFVPGHQKHDTSRATNTQQITRYRHADHRLLPSMRHWCTLLILIMSRRPPRCRRAEANSPTLELTSGTDGPWFDLVITRWYPTGGRIGAPSRWSQRLAWSQRSPAFAFSPWIARTTRSSPISASRRK